ncbi:CMRF35-like molecule 1 [Anoplopoma fimbria]|uniref:CMRF35-like molecule 1 n=1 Tax=Anoplopoma fimbria TaxID=229290 RepID=UPI0023ED9F2C|nr:CMRF35-like molecule 1 [Anoplopoma fimbria]
MKTISVFCCLLYAAGIQGADIKVEGFEGGEVSFQCSHKLASTAQKYFCKDPCKNREDRRVTVEAGGRASSERITLVDSGDGVFTVTFSHLKLSDSGKFWCAVERIGFNTYTEVQVTVKEAVANETTTTALELSSTWIYPNISNSTEITSRMDASRHANLLTASNSTNGGKQKSSTGTVVYATVGAVSMLTVVILAIIVGKRRVNLKPQPQVCSKSTDLVSADEREADCEYDDVGVDKKSMKKLPERISCSHDPKQNPPAAVSTAVESSVPIHIYENICCSKDSKHSRHSAANVQDGHDISSGIYIKPLPHISERTGKSCIGENTNKPTETNVTSKPTESCTGNASNCHMSSCSDSTEVRPRSLWFGLDISGIK